MTDEELEEYLPRSPYALVTESERHRLYLMRKSGSKKPPGVSPGDWWGPQTLKGHHKNCCLLAAGGFLNRHVARHFGINESRLSVILSASNSRRLIAQYRRMYSFNELFDRCVALGLPPDARWWS